MARFPKFLIGEIDGAELPGASEYEPVIEDIYIDASKQETLKDVIDDNALGYEDFFMYSLDRDFTIPGGRSKLISHILEINNFTLQVDGILEVS